MLFFKSLVTVLRLLVSLVDISHVCSKAILVITSLILNKLNEYAFTRIDCDVDIFNWIKKLSALLLVQNKVNSHVHYQLTFQNIFDLFNLWDLVEVDGHLELLVVAALNQSFRSNKSENYHSNILLYRFFGILVSALYELAYIDTNRVEFVD